MNTKEFIGVLVRLLNKDMDALKIVYEQFFQKIYKTAFSVVKNSEDAYDLSLNVIMKLIEYPSNPYLIATIRFKKSNCIKQLESDLWARTKRYK